MTAVGMGKGKGKTALINTKEQSMKCRGRQGPRDGRRRTVTEGALISSFGSAVTTCVIGHGLLRRRREWSDVLAEPLAALVERADRRGDAPCTAVMVSSIYRRRAGWMRWVSVAAVRKRTTAGTEK